MPAFPSNRVLIFEPSLSGHRAHYVSVHAQELMKIGAEVCLAVPENALSVPEGKVFLSELLPQVQHWPLPTLPSGLSTLASANAKLSLLQDTVSKYNPGHCYVPYADGVSQAWGMKRKPRSLFPKEMPIEGLVMRETYAYPSSGWKATLASRASLFFQCRAGWSRLHHLDPLGFEVIEGRKTNSERHCLIPDIIERPQLIDAREAKRSLGVDPSKYLVACPGAVNRSKGSHSLIDAVLGMDESTGVQLILLGKHSEEIRGKIKSVPQDPRIISLDRFASSEEFNLLFSAADTIAVCYPKHCGSASILLRAIASGAHVIASRYGWIGWATEKFGLGATCDAESPAAIRRLIQIAIASGQKIESSKLDLPAESFLNYHSEGNHLAHWTALYRQRQGLSPADDAIDFDFVLRHLVTVQQTN